MSIAGVALGLGILGYWWYLRADIGDTEMANAQLRAENQQLRQEGALFQANVARLGQSITALEKTNMAPKTANQDTHVLKGRIAAIEDTQTTLEGGMRETEMANAQLRAENQQLRQESALLQANAVDLKSRIDTLESTQTTLKNVVESMRKQLATSIAKRDARRVVPEKNRRVTSKVASGQGKNPAAVESQRHDMIRSLANDELVQLLVQFLVTYEHHATGWFSAPGIQSIEGQQEQFVLFQYHSWATIDTKLRRMERVGMVKGRDADDPRIGRQFTIRHGAPLTTFQTLASRY
jgi:DNA-binding protein H-NS